MFFREKQSGAHRYLQIVENFREGAKTRQRVIGTLGRVEHLQKQNWTLTFQAASRWKKRRCLRFGSTLGRERRAVTR